MSIPMNSQQVLDREYLEIRGKILEVAASLDRLERAAGDVAQDPRMTLIQQGLQIALQSNDAQGDSRAKQIQLLFSREYADSWRKEFEL
ncbi:MAG TPA: hypothetical protein EYN93_14945 [Planctomycetaceae bacterium]|nr:hypothetical protein [Planctomycetaceae bacterium]